jgi:hypothetical protein
VSPLVYLVPIALAVAFGYLVVRVWRSWKDADSRWGDGAPELPDETLSKADLDDDMRQAGELREDRERRAD